MSGKPVGRPRKYRSKRTTLAVRVTLAMYDLLKARCAVSKRSLSEEVELVLEKVFFPLGLPDGQISQAAAPTSDEAAA